jgi:hypothetical protein
MTAEELKALMTLDELEAWWEEHQDEWAHPNNPQSCLIAVPIQRTLDEIADDAVAWVDVQPNDDGVGMSTFRDYDLKVTKNVPLPENLNALAVAFDHTPFDGFDGHGDGYVSGEKCLALIREFKAKEV